MFQTGRMWLPRAIVMRQKTERRVQFEMTDTTRMAVEAWVAKAQLKTGDFLFPSRVQQSPHIGTRPYARIVEGWVEGIGLDNASFGTHLVGRCAAPAPATELRQAGGARRHEPKRSPLLPNVPTLGEAMGIMRDDDFVAWYGVLVPARTPMEVVARLEKAAFAVLNRPDTRTKFAALGTDLVAMPSGQFAQRMRTESKQYGEIIKRFGIKAT